MKILRLALFICLAVAARAGSADEPVPHILMVVTSHGQIDDTHPTGLWLEEFAVPYEMFAAAEYRVTVSSPRGGKAPVDPRSLGDRDRYSEATLAALENTIRLADVDLARFDAVFFPGGHGTMFDLPNDESVKLAVRHFVESRRPAAFVCHGPAALAGATLSDGSPLVAGRRVTGFTDNEERAVELDGKMPFLLETRLRELGANFVGADNFVEHVVVDGKLVTGQNPASSAAAARALLAVMAVQSDAP